MCQSKGDGEFRVPILTGTPVGEAAGEAGAGTAGAAGNKDGSESE